jgi:hypothetical protein
MVRTQGRVHGSAYGDKSENSPTTPFECTVSILWFGGKMVDPKFIVQTDLASGKQTVGVLHRRHVRVERIIYTGKESNRLEEIEAGVIHSPESVYTEYPDPSRDELPTRILPILKKIPMAALIRVSGKSRSMLRRTIAGQSRSRRKNQQLLKSILQRLGVI